MAEVGNASAPCETVVFHNGARGAEDLITKKMQSFVYWRTSENDPPRHTRRPCRKQRTEETMQNLASLGVASAQGTAIRTGRRPPHTGFLRLTPDERTLQRSLSRHSALSDATDVDWKAQRLAMKVFLDTIKPGYTIRSDIFGFYLCSAAEAEQSDTGRSHSAGCDLRLHWETLEEAVSALQNWKPAQSTSPGVQAAPQPAGY